MGNDRKVAYFSMEIAIQQGIPTYSGGLGVLAGDMIRSAADAKVPMVAVTLLHRKGYFYQRLDASGQQTEEPSSWVVEDFLQKQDATITLEIEGRTVRVGAWKYDVTGLGGFAVPVLFLDTDLPENSAWDRTLTDYLYGGDDHYRLCQEVILGIGGARMLQALGHKSIERFHMNEGHAALLALELLDEQLEKVGRTSITPEDVEAVKERCVFTTHTPVVAGHDQFPMDMVRKVISHEALEIEGLSCCGGLVNLTYLALNLSRYVNGVAKRHGEVSRLMFAPYTIDSITNGVHGPTWVSPSFQALFDRHIPGWREDNFSLRYALSIPKEEIWAAHLEAKRELVQYVNRETNAGMHVDALTLGFARRAAVYKRGDLLFQDPARLRAIVAKAGPLQVVYAGKAHPMDQSGKDLIRRIFEAAGALKNDVKVAYLANYDMAMGKLITAGADVWLNTPEPPQEASGTSGMKSALNGVPSLSILDGWWIEGCIEGVTGWAIGERVLTGAPHADRAADAAALYDKLENVVLPAFYRDRDRFLNVMLHSIALNGSFFNTQRMIEQYCLRAYFL